MTDDFFASPEELEARKPQPYQCKACGVWLTYNPSGILVCGNGLCDDCFRTCFDEASSYCDFHIDNAAWHQRFYAVKQRIKEAVKVA